MSNAPTERFSNRVENYIKYRPGYPVEIIVMLRERWGLSADSVIADIGSGTGISSELFLKQGNRVMGIEPNREMRNAAERLLARYGDRFQSVTGTAEASTLPDHSVDFVVAGQAFHWFERDKARAEFLRILKPGGSVVLIWNERKTGTTPFLHDYEALLIRFGTDYEQVNHTRIDDSVIAEFFRPAPFELHTFHNQQQFDFAGLKGRLLSSSYAPDEQHPNHGPMLRELGALFEKHSRNDRVSFDYDTKVYVGRLA